MTLIATDVSVSFGSHLALDRACFSARQGEVSAIVGPNGSGKTTLIRALCGDVACSGTIFLNDLNARHTPAARIARMRAVLPQASSVAFPFTVLELVRLGLTAGLPTEDRSEIASLPAKALRRVGLAGYEGRMVQELSGGERQRAQLARVLVQIWQPVIAGAPRWLFLDEPVSALDIRHQLLIMEIARGYARAGGGVVAVMHDLNLTAMFADRVTLMSRGRVRAAGVPQDVLTDAALSDCYGCDLRTNTPPATGTPWILPQAAGLEVGPLG